MVRPFTTFSARSCRAIVVGIRGFHCFFVRKIDFGGLLCEVIGFPTFQFGNVNHPS